MSASRHAVVKSASIITLAGLLFASFAPFGCSSSNKGSFEKDAGLDVDLGPSLINDGSAFDEATIGNGGRFNDGAPTTDATDCTPDASVTKGPVVRQCISFGGDQNECDGNHDLNGFPANGTTGNGFDDDCDGLVDEGCDCPGPGVTKECYLVPALQTANGKPVGFCKENSKGTVDCQKKSAEAKATWSGICRGAQPPFADDICSRGDFDCDGKDLNSRSQDCSCKPGTVQCPTTPLVTSPYPNPSNLPLKVDAAPWFSQPNDRAQAKNWKWTIRGGDCDNILPHPTFAAYPTSSGLGNPVGLQVNNLGTSQLEHGYELTPPSITSSFYPAFSLSGDYLVTGEFDLYGDHKTCQIKIQVRAPGIRAESCWDTLKDGVDLDLHMAKVDGFSTCTQKGWSDTCKSQDCYYSNCSDGGFSTNPQWYSASPSTACVGWGSQSTATSCGNPRLDRDANGLSGECDETETNPNSSGGSFLGGFCGPENINVDNPTDGSQYAVSLKYFRGSTPSRSHVNVYCNGERILSAGYNPITQQDFPKLVTDGANFGGDMWKVALITAKVQGSTLSCDVTPTRSQNPHTATDGSNSYCVDNASSDSADSTKFLASGGNAPANADALCFH